MEQSKEGQSQKHGFDFENSIRKNVFKLEHESNDTNIHDIPKHLNIINNNENCSIKTTGSNLICCGDVLRFYNYDFNEKNTIIVIKYIQTETHKIVETIYEIDYNRECHELLFGNMPKDVIETYVNSVKSIPAKVKGEEAKKIFDYLIGKKNLKNQYTNKIQINPKIDGSQSRVQCSIPKFEETLKDFITYKSQKEKPNILRETEILLSVESTKRKRKTKISTEVLN